MLIESGKCDSTARLTGDKEKQPTGGHKAMFRIRNEPQSSSDFFTVTSVHLQTLLNIKYFAFCCYQSSSRETMSQSVYSPVVHFL